MKANFNNFSSYQKKLEQILSLIAPFRDKLPVWAGIFFDASCVDFFNLIPPVNFSDIERYNFLVEIYKTYVKRRETV